jgi:small-conductance mechanosensitive channel
MDQPNRPAEQFAELQQRVAQLESDAERLVSLIEQLKQANEHLAETVAKLQGRQAELSAQLGPAAN